MDYFKKIAIAAGALGALALPAYAQDKDVPKRMTLDETVRFVGKGEFFGSENFRRAAGNWKLLAGEEFGIYGQGQHALQEQDFETGELEGTINRIGGGAYKYFPFSIDSPKDSAIYTDFSLIYENRDFEFMRELDGETFPFGNDALNYVGKLGFVKKGSRRSFDDEQPHFDPSEIKLLGTIAYADGEMKGDLDDDYNRWLATLYGRIRLSQDWFLQGGVFRKKEDLIGGEWKNNETAAELGFGTDAYLFLGQTPFELYLKGTYRDLETERNGVTSSSEHLGARLDFTLKPSDNVEIGGFAGHEADDGDTQGLGNYGGVQFKIYLGPSGRK